MKKDSTELNRYCPKCNTLLFDGDSICPVCRREVKKLDAAVTHGMGLFFRVLLIIVVVVFAAAAVLLLARNKESITGFFHAVTAFFS